MQQRLILLLLLLLSACTESNITKVSDTPKNPYLSVQTTSVNYQDVPRFYSATGYTTIARTIEISSSQSGTIENLEVDEGDVVKAGALLIVIDESELLTTIKKAKSARESAKISLKDSLQGLNTSKQLRQSKVISVEKLRKAQIQLDLANANFAQANSELIRQEARKPYYRITSPIAARVVKRWVSQGDLAVVGKPLLQLEAIEGLEFQTALPTQWIDQIKVGDRYQLQLHHANKPIAATVSHIVHSVNRITQTYQIKLSLADTDKLTAGLSGQIDFIVANEMLLVVPESSLIIKAGVLGVFRLDEKNNVHFNPVRIERRWQLQRVVLSGLEKDDLIVINPPFNLRDAVQVNVLAEIKK